MQSLSPRMLLLSVIFLTLSFASSTRAGLILALDDRGVDLTSLVVGQTVTIDVILSGLDDPLPPLDALNYLAGTVDFQNNLLGSAFNVAPGAIVPDVSGFLGTGLSGLADANYDILFSFNPLPIGLNGVLFSFDVTAQDIGAGSFSIDASSLAARDVNDNVLTLSSGAALPFSVNAVPEPGSLALLSASICTFFAVSRRLSIVRRAKNRTDSFK